MDATTRYEYWVRVTTGEDAIIRVDGDNVVACYWGIASDRRGRWLADMASGDARGYIDLNGDRLDEPMAYDDFCASQLRGGRLLASMTA